MTLTELLFPELKGKWAADIKWDYLARNAPFREQNPNPLLIPWKCEEWMRQTRKTMGMDYSWGGYLEDRSVLWRGHYHKPGHTIHLGVDFDVPAGTTVHLPFTGKLIHSWVDQDKEGGWGGRLMFELFDRYLLFGHLKLPKNLVLDKVYREGKRIGKVANYPENGNWYPHLHLQCCKKLNTQVDGYSEQYEGIERDFPNCWELIK